MNRGAITIILLIVIIAIGYRYKIYKEKKK